MEYRCRLDSLGIYPLLLEVATPRGEGRHTRATVRPTGLFFFMLAVPFSMYSLFYSHLLPLFLCRISFMLFSCTSVSENTCA